jgi:predicted metal-dependent HD superfamily phosphohydrolase
MLALPGPGPETHLIQIRIPNSPANDAEFFRFLKAQYETHRRHWHDLPHFWNSLSGIHFVRFRTEHPTR